MKNHWQEIWNKKQLDLSSQSILEQLITVDGFSSPFGGLKDTVNWLNYLDYITNKLPINQGESIFEVGCGGGAFLYPFYQKGHEIGGIDYSENLVNIALQAMPKADIIVSEATKMPEGKQFDVVVSNGVFFYFPNYDYGEIILKRMVKMATKSVGIFDVADLAKKEEAIQHRKATIGEAEYQRKYKGLDHLYYPKNWFEKVLTNESVIITIEDQNIEGYGNSQYRFNVFIQKR